MNEPKGLFKHKFILILTIFSFVAAYAEGIVFYPDDDAFFKFLMVLQNSISAFAFRPSIGLRDAMQKMVEDPNTVKMVICYTYGLAVFTAPYCTVAAVYRLLENMLRFVFRIRKSKGGKMTTLFGYNEEVKTLINDFIKTTDKDSFLYVVTDKEISSDERFELSKHNCFVSTLDITVLTPEQVEREFKKLHIDCAETLILFDESSLKNFSVLRMFRMGDEETGVALMSGAKVICRCEDEGMSKLVEDYYDSRRGGRFAFDLETVSLPELQVYKLYNDVPLHTFYLNSDKKLSEWDMRMLVVGFGETGRQAVLKAMNLGVVSAGNSIVIDVFDLDGNNKLDIFANTFGEGTFHTDNNSLIMNSDTADGRFEINFHSINVRSRRFIETVEANDRISPYTYALVSIGETSASVDCAMQLNRYFSSKVGVKTPVILRSDDNPMIADYIAGNDTIFSDIRIMEKRSDILSLDLLMGRQLDSEAKNFNKLYHNINIVSDGGDSANDNFDAERAWLETKLFKRASSRAAAYHEPIKQVVIDRLAHELNVDPEKKIDELVGKNGSLFTDTGSAWRLNGSESDVLERLIEDDFAYEIASMEHRRWCCYMVSAGWTFGERSDILKQNPCLVTQDKLVKTAPDMCKYDVMSLMARYRSFSN